MRHFHLVMGSIALLAFLASGQYMDVAYDHLRGQSDTTRMLFRSTHIYLLFTALLNLALGLYFVPSLPGWRRWLQGAGSVLLLIAPPLVAVAFIVEPLLTGLERPYSRPAVIGSLVGVLLQWVSRWPAARKIL